MTNKFERHDFTDSILLEHGGTYCMGSWSNEDAEALCKLLDKGGLGRVHDFAQSAGRTSILYMEQSKWETMKAERVKKKVEPGPDPTKCVYDKAWIGKCGEVAAGDPPICEEHRGRKCWCGVQAVRECPVALSLVCGARLCAEHDCASMVGAFTGNSAHSKKGRAQFEAWKAAQS